jgi:hypothetical protein
MALIGMVYEGCTILGVSKDFLGVGAKNGTVDVAEDFVELGHGRVKLDGVEAWHRSSSGGAGNGK